ncbi:hypothetical protein ACQJ0Y_24560 [Peribacillus simplex]|uniref:hypothetical protein n=1 Tax=Peribacillus simplex TaxID=1478 RepID=UPI003CE7ABDC
MKKILSVFIAVSMLTLSLSINNVAHAQSNEEMTDSTVSSEELAKVATMVKAIEELDKKIGLENLDNLEKLSDIKQNDFDSLSKETQDFFNFVKEAEKENSSLITGENGLSVLSTYVHNLDSLDSKTMKATIASVGSVTERKISNAQMKNLNLAVTGNSGFWTLSGAIAKTFAKSPTALTMFIVAIPIIGIFALNVCNKKEKGVIVKDVRIGASHSYSCRSQ